MAAPSNTEQYLLELINYTRLDPVGAAKFYISGYSPLTSSDAGIQGALNYFGVSGSALEAAFLALAPSQPLAWNGSLADAAAAHSQAMIDHDQQSHQLPGEAGLGTRLSDAGYNYSYAGENVYAYAESMLFAHAGFMVDWGYGPDGMQDPPGHRTNLMDGNFREVGLGVIAESDPATGVGPYVVTEDFGVRLNSPQVFLLGVTYADGDHDHFYSVGEGRGGMTVATDGASGTSASSGGYTLELSAGDHTITYSGGGLSSALVVSTNLTDGSNAKIDVRGSSTLLSSVSLQVVSGVTHVIALGVQDLDLTGAAGAQTLDGNSAANVLSGLGGNDVLNGFAGSDRLLGANGRDFLYGGGGNDVLKGGGGNDVMVGGTGADKYIVDSVDDVVVERPGQGVDLIKSSVTFSLDNTDGKQSANTSSNVENLTLTGTDAIDGTGNGYDNVLIGNAADNRLTGNAGNDSLYGGAGNDLLTGGNGADCFVFDKALNVASNVDTITDFLSGVDRILLDDNVFQALGPVATDTTLTADKFYAAADATAAHDADDRIIYNTSTGALYYDADGTGASYSAIQFATLGVSTHPGLVASDLVVIA